MVRFHHEVPQTGTRAVDIGVHVTVIGAAAYSRYVPFLVIEAKRLPADRRGREREYVSGFTPQGSPTGGIQRFKLGLHGGSVEVAAMVGYVQRESPEHWHEMINGWIRALADQPSSDGCVWSPADMLQPLKVDHERAVSVAYSSHSRSGAVATPIAIHHFWVCM